MSFDWSEYLNLAQELANAPVVLFALVHAHGCSHSITHSIASSIARCSWAAQPPAPGRLALAQGARQVAHAGLLTAQNVQDA